MKKFLFALCLLVPIGLHAEATKEFYSDQNPNDARLIPEAPNIFVFSANTSLDLSFKNNSATPEGLNVAVAAVSSGGGGWGIGTNGEQNYSDYANGAIRFWLQSNTDLTLEIEGPKNRKRSVTVVNTGGAWQEKVIPFSSFSSNPNFNFAQVVAVFLISASGGGSKSWSIDHLRWTKPVTSLVVFPSSTEVNPTKKRQFTVEGRNNGERVIIYSTFTASAGSMSPDALTRVTASTFTAGGSAGNSVITARLAGSALSGTANVTVTSADLSQELGLLSETIPNSLVFDSDSRLGKASSPGTSLIVTADESSGEVREGVRSFKSTVLPQGSAEFRGWFIQHSTLTSDAVTRDMNLYFDGSIRFWFKGPPALQDALVFGIRSGNAEAGTELSKVNLKDYVTFDNTWQPVVIPVRHLAGARPWADISRTKVLFSIFAVGAVADSQDFYIDNLRWDTRIPGDLASVAVTPMAINVLTGSRRQFHAQGFDAAGVPVDIFPTWTKNNTEGDLGSFSPAQGATTVLNADVSAATGTLTASAGGFNGVANVVVDDIVFTQSFKVYSDAGSGGFVGVSKGLNSGTDLTLSEQSGSPPPEGSTFRRATYTLVNNSGVLDAFAIWFTNVDSTTATRFMQFYEDGYLSFWVKTPLDLQVTVRSGNITAGTELSKIRLSQLGIPRDNTWQRVIIPFSDFTALDPALDFSQIQTYFAIGAISSHIGPVTNQTFDIDDVKWLTNNPAQPDAGRVYTGLQEKQHPTSGLLLSFDNDADGRAVTYDQALAAMAFTYKKDTALSKKILDAYKVKFDAASPFDGFYDEYHWDTGAVLTPARSAGPNAWILLAILHYRVVTGRAIYDAMAEGIANWLVGLKAGDGAVQFGKNGGATVASKSTEHNFDAYAAFRAYARLPDKSSFNAEADGIFNWLSLPASSGGAWNSAEQRFNVGRDSSNNPNPDKALDVYSWAPLALSSFTSVLALAETDFATTATCDLTGLSVNGYDFSGPPGQDVDKDAVWVEGTSQMAVAYLQAGNVTKANQIINELEKTVVPTSANGQGLPYATNGGTAYGFNMDSLHPAISPAAWYFFAKKNFNPFRPYSVHSLKIKNIGTNVQTSSVTWTVSAPARWVRADQYIEIDAQEVSEDSWTVRIYTDNANPGAAFRYVDPTPIKLNDPDSNPAGLLKNVVGQSTTSQRLVLAWSIKDTLAQLPPAFDPTTSGCPDFAAPNEAYQWVFIMDRNTPALDLNRDGILDAGVCDGLPFSDENLTAAVRSPLGIHITQGVLPASFAPSTGPDFIYLQVDFTPASAQINYATHIFIEGYYQ